MKFIRFALLALFFAPFASFAAPSEFAVAAQVLAAAKNADIQQVQILVNNGANVNYVDNTGLSLVCTALMNNDVRAAQILQMYGADASQCDRQIRNYRTRNVPERTGGLFGGLSTAQSMTLAAAGAAVVIGGLFLLTDVFDHDNNNSSSGGSSSGGGHGGGSGGGSGTDTGTAWSAGVLPYGPAMITAAAESANYQKNLATFYSQYLISEGVTDTSGTQTQIPNTPNYENFQLMTNATAASQNYLLLMRGYSPLARGYLGMRTMRNLETHAPLSISQYSLGDTPVEGGRPINVALITADGVNALDGTSLQDRFVVWTTYSGNASVNDANNNMISSKYYNNQVTIVNNSDLSDDTSVEDATLLSSFDLSGSGTAIHNSLANDSDNLLAKIVGGNLATNPTGDFVGFMPNGQMTIYRTGGGNAMESLSAPVAAGTCVGNTISDGDTIGLFDQNLTATVSGNSVVLSNADYTYRGYIGADGLLYMDSDGDGVVDMGYTISDNVISQTKQLVTSDYYNYTALLDAGLRSRMNIEIGTRSPVSVVANVSVIEPLHSRNAYTITDMQEADFASLVFQDFVAGMYGASTTENLLLPAVQANAFFNNLGTGFVPLTIFSTGATIQRTPGTYTDAPMDATFENAVPLVYGNGVLEHLFMSVVAVGASTYGTETIVANSSTNPNPYQLAQWSVTDDGTTTSYKSRVCGIAGTGYNGIDPWCFAATGLTDEMATAAAAGAAGVLMSAFDYMSPQQIFTLMALTADGPFLNRLSDGTKLTPATLKSHLESLYVMPTSYQNRINAGEDYLEVFKEVFGYGVVNLERATTPGTNLYYYTNGKIVSSPNNAYWRAAMNTGFRSSSALNMGRSAINMSAYDVLESIDGSMSLPRVWENSFSFGADSVAGLYMGDILSDLKTRDEKEKGIQIGKMSFDISRTERGYDDGLGGLENMHFAYRANDWTFDAGFQHYLTDGESRFFGIANPILGLASNAVTGGAEYKLGAWSFGAHGFSGAITDDGLLESDPAASNIFEPMRLGLISGAGADVGWHGQSFSFNTSVGAVHESNTLLGAFGTGLLSIGSGDTNYIDFDATYRLSDTARLRARATFAHTRPSETADSIFEFSDLDSNAFAFGADFGNLSFGVSLPLATMRGTLTYDYADYSVVENTDGNFDLAITDAGRRSLDVAPRAREVRLNASYRHSFGEFTDGAFGFIYRVNPGNTDEFGNESIFMMKMSHRIGI
ncbi:MAG: ankyrin repeat domain-containing protein [Alphaproteobacteria bacterium]|nr:ankyrin repeat domain-containing protein [Alphaproteobacteria bacterium]